LSDLATDCLPTLFAYVLQREALHMRSCHLIQVRACSSLEWAPTLEWLQPTVLPEIINYHPALQANASTAVQGIPAFHYRPYKCPSLVPVLSQLKPSLYTPILSIPQTFQAVSLFHVAPINPCTHFCSPHAYHMSHKPHLSSPDHPTHEALHYTIFSSLLLPPS
jgi:hypothetical protein